MKLIIDIPENEYRHIKEYYEKNDIVEATYSYIYHGIPLKQGHWIETADEYYKAVNEYGGGVNEDTPYFVDDIACSVCLAMFSTIDNETERFNYCPNCGAQMVEPQESEEQA